MITGAADWVAQWARTSPWRVALHEVERDRRLRYGELDARAWRLANALAAMGVEPGDRVALLARNGLETFELLVACLRLGAVFTPLNWRLAAAEVGDIVDRCAPRCLLYDADSGALAQAVLSSRPALRSLSLGAPYEALLAESSERAGETSHDGETLAMLLYTSGTTGRPKGVMLPHRQLFWNAVNTVWACDTGPEDRVLAFLPLFHTGGLNCLATPTLYRGGTVVLMQGFDPARALRVIEEQRITATVAVPTMYQMLFDAGLDKHDTSSLKTLLCGGAPCPDRLLDAYLDRGLCFRQGFGMTEVGPNCFSLPPWMVGRLRGSVGQPVLHGAARVVDEAGRVLPPGETGELCLSGPHVCRGYWGDPEATGQAIRDGWMHTGDYARSDEQGFFYVAGRKKDMFISGGENVYPAEIERVVLDFPGVLEAAVVAVPDARWGEVGLAAVVGDVDLDALRAFCAGRLARFKVPKRLERVDALPRNASGKVVKPTLRARFGLKEPTR